MKRIKSNNWYIKGNDLAIIFGHCYVSVYPIICDNQLSYVVNVMDDDNNKSLYFDTLEDSIKFIEEVIKVSKSIQDIIDNYNEYLENPKRYRK